MNTVRTNDPLTLVLLRMGIAVPFLYFGIQLLTAPFYPGYRFVGNVASELGSDLSPYRTLFNSGLMLLGLLTLLAAAGFVRALLRLGARPLLAGFTGLVVAISGVQTLWAGYFPMPDPRHGGHPLFVMNMILIPFLFAGVLWKQSGALLKAYLVATLLLIAVMIPIMTGKTGLDTQAYRGIFQRLVALAIYPPVGVGAYCLARRIQEKASGGSE
jgi:hypothetical membrane protein